MRQAAQLLRLNLPFTAWGQFVRARDELDRFLYRLIDEKAADSGATNRDDALSALLDARDEARLALDAGAERVLVRVTLGIDADTHEAIRTGHHGSKFGLPPEQARAESEEAAFRFVHEIIGWFQALSKSSPEYGYLSRIEEIVDRKDDLDFLIDRAPYLTIGTPEFFVERAKKLAAMGYDEFILRIDGMGHERHMQAIELIGKHVIPQIERAPAPVSAR